MGSPICSDSLPGSSQDISDSENWTSGHGVSKRMALSSVWYIQTYGPLAFVVLEKVPTLEHGHGPGVR